MRRLAFAIDQSGGNATYQANLANALHGTADVEATFHGIRIIDYDVWDLVPGIRDNFALSASVRAAFALQAAKRQAGTLNAAFIHSQSIALFSIPFMKRVPTVISSDGTPKNYDTFADGLEHRVYGPRTEAFKSSWTRAALKSAAKLLAFSSWVKNSFVNDYGIDPAKVEIIPSGVNVDLWTPKPSLRPNDGRVRILFTGGNFPRKGGPILLEWLARTKHRSDVELHLVTKDKLPSIPNVFAYPNMTANAPALIELSQRCDIFALPTRGDCFPFAAIEAQCAGLPAVVSNVGGMPEIVADGVTGYLCPRDDKQAFFARLDALVGDQTLRERMGAAAAPRARERFDASKNSQRVLELLLSVAS